MNEKMFRSDHFQAKFDPEVIQSWKSIYNEYVRLIKPVEKDAARTLEYIRKKYIVKEFESPIFKKVVYLNARQQRDYFPSDCFGKNSSTNIQAMIIQNEGQGAHLYERQYLDFEEIMVEHPELKDSFKPGDFPCPVMLGIEMKSGYVHVEGSPTLSEEIVMVQGLNSQELTNFYLVARYINILKKYNRLDSIIAQS